MSKLTWQESWWEDYKYALSEPYKSHARFHYRRAGNKGWKVLQVRGSRPADKIEYYKDVTEEQLRSMLFALAHLEKQP